MKRILTTSARARMVHVWLTIPNLETKRNLLILFSQYSIFCSNLQVAEMVRIRHMEPLMSPFLKLLIYDSTNVLITSFFYQFYEKNKKCKKKSEINSQDAIVCIPVYGKLQNLRTWHHLKSGEFCKAEDK